MSLWEAPGKLNLSLLVHPRRPDGFHPIESMVQTVEWCDILDIEDGADERDRFATTHPDLDPEDNLVVKALTAVRARGDLPPQIVTLEKSLPIAAGMGGGSSDAAATVAAAGLRAGLNSEDLADIAVQLGADVPLFLTGGTLRLGGIGEQVYPLPELSGLAVAVVVPEFGLDTVDVYRAWDHLEGPVGEALPVRVVPPPLRDGMPLRNDLLPAALHIEPGLGDFMAEIRAVWGQPLAMTGSGSACFGYFPAVDEAVDAAASVAHLCSMAHGVDLRSRGVAVCIGAP